MTQKEKKKSHDTGGKSCNSHMTQKIKFIVKATIISMYLILAKLEAGHGLNAYNLFTISI